MCAWYLFVPRVGSSASWAVSPSLCPSGNGHPWAWRCSVPINRLSLPSRRDRLCISTRLGKAFEIRDAGRKRKDNANWSGYFRFAGYFILKDCSDVLGPTQNLKSTDSKQVQDTSRTKVLVLCWIWFCVGFVLDLCWFCVVQRFETELSESWSFKWSTDF